MYRNWERKSAKRYLITVVLIFIGAFAIGCAIVFGLAHLNESLTLSLAQKFGIALLCALAPVSSFTGFCVLFIRIDNLTKKQIIFMIAFCIPLVIVTLPFGLIMLFPTIAKSILLLKTE